MTVDALSAVPSNGARLHNTYCINPDQCQYQHWKLKVMAIFAIAQNTSLLIFYQLWHDLMFWAAWNVNISLFLSLLQHANVALAVSHIMGCRQNCKSPRPVLSKSETQFKSNSREGIMLVCPTYLSFAFRKSFARTATSVINHCIFCLSRVVV